MRATLLAIAFFLISAMADAQENAFTSDVPDRSGAWWLHTQYHPFATEVRGIPLAKLRSNWCKANEFRTDLFPAEYRKDIDYSREFGQAFAIDGLFDGSKIKQTALTGVYETCKGERGAFVLVLAWPEGKPPAIRFLRELPGEIAFTILSVSDASTIAVLYCLDCDHVDRWRWSKTKKSFVLLPPEY
jgi:hypothetical protein